MGFNLGFKGLEPWLYLTLQWYNSNTPILHIFSISYEINHLKTKHRLLYLKTRSIPRS